MLKRFINFIIGLKFGIILFLIIALYSIIGTLIPQGLGADYYLQNYKTFGNLIILLQFTKVYSSIFFRAIVLIFIINLVGCTLNILPAQLNKMKNTYFPNRNSKANNLFNEDIDLENFKESLKKKRFKITNNDEGFYVAKHRIGNLGSSITHLGIIIIIVGGFIGNMFSQEGFFNMIPGDMKAFNEYGFTLGLDDFYLEFREDGSIGQYHGELSIYEDGVKIDEKEMWVNKPLSHNKLDFFQSNFGWVSNMQIKDKGNIVLDSKLLKDGQQFFYQPEHITIYLYGFFPDFHLNKAGDPFSMTQRMNNPHYAVVLYHLNDYIDSYVVEPGQEIIYNDLKIEFLDPTLYTGITYRQDSGYIYVLIGCCILLLGLTLSFYFYPKYILVTKESILPITRQNSWGYEIQINNILKTTKNKGKGEL